jgi:hypothetical protein
VAGTNVVEIGSVDRAMFVANVNIVLVDVPGGVPVLPGSINTYPGITGGTPVPTAINAVCGSANGTAASAPTANLCSVGTASSVRGSGPWSWTCTGSNGGSDASCSAQKTTVNGVNGVCGSANSSTLASAPSTNLCSTGSATAVSGSGAWTWSCNGSNGGTNAACSANKTTSSTGQRTFTPSANCSLGTAAFCDTFNTPSATRGRGGDLDPAKWATARLSGEIMMSGQGALNPVPIAPIPACRSGITQTSVFPPNDTLVCDATGGNSAQLMSAVAIQNYGVNSYMSRQPFDFAGRTGKIVFDVDAVSSALGGYIEIEVTEDPMPATTYRQWNNNEVGAITRNGISIRTINACGSNPTSRAADIGIVDAMVYNNYVGTVLKPTFDQNRSGCSKTSLGSLNHFEVRLSQNHIDVYVSDFSTDNAETFPNFKLIYSADINLPFTRGYVHFNAKNHATEKYGFGPDAVFHWDNLGFDGPVIAAPRAYEIADNKTMSTNNNKQVMNLGYLLLDGVTGKAAGMYDPANKIDALTFQNVSTSGMTSATLTFNAFFNGSGHTPNTGWGISYRLNGGTVRTVNLTQPQIDSTTNNTGGLVQAILAFVVDVPTTDLVSGNNTIEFLPINAPMDYPPVITNIDLLLGTSGN